jgi:tetratricopeptide (TPR) repeat protein
MRRLTALAAGMLVFFTLPGHCFAQTPAQGDSLLRAWKNVRPDTAQADLLLRVAWQCMDDDPARSLTYSTAALQRAHQLNNGRQTARSLYAIAFAHARQGDYEEAIAYYKQSARVAGQVKDQPAVAAAHAGMGHVYLGQGHYNQALAWFQQALALARSGNDKPAILSYMHHLSTAFKYKGDYAKAMEYELKTLRLAEEDQNLRMVAQANNSLGTSFFTQGNLAKAKEYYLNSLRWSTGRERPLMAETLGNLGNVYLKGQAYDSALVYYQQSLRLREDTKDRKGLQNALENIGEVYFRKGQLSEARNACQRALTLARQQNDRRGEARSLIDLAGIYQGLKQPANALSYANRGTELARKIGAKDVVQEGYETLIGLTEQRGDYRQAFLNQKLYSQYRDSIAGEATTNKIHELHAQYESEKKEQQIKRISQQAQIQQLELEQQRLYLIGLVVVVAVIVLLGYLFFRQSILRNQHKTIDLEQKLLRAQMNPHFIFNALTAIQQFMYANHPAEAGRYLSKFAKLMRLTLENSRDEYITLQKEIQTLEHYFELQRLRFGDKFDYTIQVDPELDPEEVAVPPMFAQPLVENSLEHGILHKSDKGLVQVRYRKLADSMVLEVEDNGVGRKRAAQLTPVGGRRQYASLATQITQERLKLFNRNKSHKVKLTLVDLVDDNNVVLGTKATFAIPYKPLNN